MTGAWWLRAGRLRSETRPTPAETTTPTADDLRMMGRALELADRASSIGEVPVGAVVYRAQGSEIEILGEGFNLRERDNDPTAHAELIAIRAACAKLGDWRLTGCSLAVTLEPCPMCAGVIVNARLPRVVYGADDPKAGAARTLFSLLSDARLNHRAEIVPGVLAGDSADRLRAFFRSLRSSRRSSRR